MWRTKCTFKTMYIYDNISLDLRKPTEVDWRFTEKGERVRVSTRTGRIIPLPDSAKETEEFVLPKTYIGMYHNVTCHMYIIKQIINEPRNG